MASVIGLSCRTQAGPITKYQTLVRHYANAGWLVWLPPRVGVIGARVSIIRLLMFEV